MFAARNVEPVDYLVIGHLTRDIAPDSVHLGGTAAYAALTASAMGLRVGVVTAWNPDIPLEELAGIQVSCIISDQVTTFTNRQTPQGRVQTIEHPAQGLNFSHVPELWRRTPIVHLGPVAQEVDPGLIRCFSESEIYLTPQGWLREWDKSNLIHPCEWPEARMMLERSTATVLSIEDLAGDEARIEEMAAYAKILVVTEGSLGARLYWNGDLRWFPAPAEQEIDSVGAGDIFATAFFARLSATRDPWEAGRFATLLAANSVTRPLLAGIPTRAEIEEFLIEVN